MPSQTETAASGSAERSIRGKFLMNAALTAMWIFLALQYPMAPLGAVVAGVSGVIVGVGFAAFLDRYRGPLEQWNDLLVFAAFLVPTLAILFGMSYVVSFAVVGYQMIGAICAVWAAMVQEILADAR